MSGRCSRSSAGSSPIAEPAWAELRRRGYPAAWLDHLRELDGAGEAINVDAADLAALGGGGEDDAQRLLDSLADLRWLVVATIRKCPVCNYRLPEGYPAAPRPDHRSCPTDDPEEPPHAFTDDGDDGPLEERVYHRTGVARRHVGWVLALHGMNTRAAWQESFNWLVSTSYGRMVPVAIYKYGVVRPGVLSRRRHGTLRRRLVARIARASAEAGRIVEDPRPDVIAHSFGTLLLGHALHEHRGLRVGRIVTLGCILRPDFDWATLVRRGQVEAVLNHFGTRDRWAAVAHGAIPDAGPAGRRGFDLHRERWREQDQAAPPVLNVPACGFGHSDFFTDHLPHPTVLERQFAEVWQPFLATADLAEARAALARRGHREVWAAERWRSRLRRRSRHAY